MNGGVVLHANTTTKSNSFFLFHDSSLALLAFVDHFHSNLVSCLMMMNPSPSNETKPFGSQLICSSSSNSTDLFFHASGSLRSQLLLHCQCQSSSAASRGRTSASHSHSPSESSSASSTSAELPLPMPLTPLVQYYPTPSTCLYSETTTALMRGLMRGGGVGGMGCRHGSIDSIQEEEQQDQDMEQDQQPQQPQTYAFEESAW